MTTLEAGPTSSPQPDRAEEESSLSLPVPPGIATLPTPSTRQRRAKVTAEARRVLESFLLKGVSPKELQATGYNYGSLSAGEVDECPYTTLQSNDSYRRATELGAHFLDDAALPALSYQAPPALDEPDYAEPDEPEEEEEVFDEIDEGPCPEEYIGQHAPVGKAPSVSSQSSFGFSFRGGGATSRSRSPSDKLLFSVNPPKIKSKAGKAGAKKKCLFDSSSSSTEDYEYCDNELLKRKKKSFFKRASERLRQSFRRYKVPEPGHTCKQTDLFVGQGALHPSPQLAMGLIQPSDPEIKEGPHKKKSKKAKLKFSLNRAGSQKSKSNQSSSTPSEIVAGAECQPKDKAAVSESDDPSQLLADDRNWRKPPLPSKHHDQSLTRKKDYLASDGVKEKERSLLDNLLKPFRKGSQKLKHKKGLKEDKHSRQKSRSADNLVLKPLDEEHRKLLQRYIGTSNKEPEDDSSKQNTIRSLHDVSCHRVDTGVSLIQKPTTVWYPSSPLPPTPKPTEEEIRYSRLRDDGPGDGDQARRGSLGTAQSLAQQGKIESDLDDVDGRQLCDILEKSHLEDKPFHERTLAEKEILYEKIAEQLAAIADHYHFDFPRSPKSSSRSASGRSHSEEDESGLVAKAEACTPPEETTTKETQIDEGGHIYCKRKKMATFKFGNMSPAVEELVRTASYSQFQQIVNENIGNDTGWEQIALMFRLTQTSIQLAGMGTAVALQMKEMTLKYFEDKFAAWLVGKGGWESMVEETNTELDSELD